MISFFRDDISSCCVDLSLTFSLFIELIWSFRFIFSCLSLLISLYLLASSIAIVIFSLERFESSSYWLFFTSSLSFVKALISYDESMFFDFASSSSFLRDSFSVARLSISFKRSLIIEAYAFDLPRLGLLPKICYIIWIILVLHLKYHHKDCKILLMITNYNYMP